MVVLDTMVKCSLVEGLVMGLTPGNNLSVNRVRLRTFDPASYPTSLAHSVHPFLLV